MEHELMVSLISVWLQYSCISVITVSGQVRSHSKRQFPHQRHEQRIIAWYKMHVLSTREAITLIDNQKQESRILIWEKNHTGSIPSFNEKQLAYSMMRNAQRSGNCGPTPISLIIFGWAHCAAKWTSYARTVRFNWHSLNTFIATSLACRVVR